MSETANEPITGQAEENAASAIGDDKFLRNVTEFMGTKNRLLQEKDAVIVRLNERIFQLETQLLAKREALEDNHVVVQLNRTMGNMTKDLTAQETLRKENIELTQLLSAAVGDTGSLQPSTEEAVTANGWMDSIDQATEDRVRSGGGAFLQFAVVRDCVRLPGISGRERQDSAYYLTIKCMMDGECNFIKQVLYAAFEPHARGSVYLYSAAGMVLGDMAFPSQHAAEAAVAAINGSVVHGARIFLFWTSAPAETAVNSISTDRSAQSKLFSRHALPQPDGHGKLLVMFDRDHLFTETTLRAVFANYGIVVDCVVPPRKHFALVTFEMKHLAEKAGIALDGRKLNGTRIFCDWMSRKSGLDQPSTVEIANKRDAEEFEPVKEDYKTWPRMKQMPLHGVPLPHPEGGYKLKVNLSHGTDLTLHLLKAAFAPYGPVKDIHVPTGRAFALVSFDTMDLAAAAGTALSGSVVNEPLGSFLNCEWAVPNAHQNLTRQQRDDVYRALFEGRVSLFQTGTTEEEKLVIDFIKVEDNYAGVVSDWPFAEDATAAYVTPFEPVEQASVDQQVLLISKGDVEPPSESGEKRRLNQLLELPVTAPRSVPDMQQSDRAGLKRPRKTRSPGSDAAPLSLLALGSNKGVKVSPKRKRKKRQRPL